MQTSIYASIPKKDCPQSIPYFYLLSRPVQERHNRASRTVLINTERSLLRSGCIAVRYLLLGAPKDCVVEGMGLRHILERGR